MDSWIAVADSPADSSLPDDPGLETFLWYVFRNRRGCDVHFELQRGAATVPAHRMILSMWSPKFADMFYAGEKRNNLERVPLDDDVKPEAFETMLGYMYGVDPPFDSIKKTTELYQLATRFEIRGLSELCLERMTGVEINVTNVFEVLESARCSGHLDQVLRCLEIVQRKTRNILTLYECGDFTPSMVHTILDCPRLAIKCEYELLNWLLAWARIRCKECSEYSTVREVLKEFLPKLNFMDLTSTQFATIFSQYEGVFEDKEALSLFMNIGLRGSMKLPDWCNPNESREYLV